MPAVLLALFPLLVLYNVPMAFGALGVAIVLIYRGRGVSPARGSVPRRLDDNAV